jgi:polyphenol oxidase
VRIVAEQPAGDGAPEHPGAGTADPAAGRTADPADGVRLFSHPGWMSEMPWLATGITAGSDMSLFGATPAGQVLPRWLRLPHSLACRAIVHAHQVHRDRVVVHEDAVCGVVIAGEADGHVTAAPGILLAVSVADCVPIYIAAREPRAVALLHGGWRGVVAGILERGLEALRDLADAGPDQLHVHFGPAICGRCFEVGPEVPAALGLDADPHDRSHVDLRSLLAGRVIDLGVPARQVSISSYCTRCGDSPFYSHRAGCAERQVALLGVRET